MKYIKFLFNDKKNLSFLYFFVICLLKNFLKDKFKFLGRDGEELQKKRQFYKIIMYALSDDIGGIFLHFEKKLVKDEDEVDKIKSKIGLNPRYSLIFNELEPSEDTRRKTIIKISISDFIARLCFFIFYLATGDEGKMIEDHNLHWIIVIDIFSKYLFSKLIVNYKIEKHHLFSFIFNFIGLGLLVYTDMIDILKDFKRDYKIYMILIFMKYNLYSYSNAYAKVSLYDDFLSPLGVIFYKGIFNSIFSIIMMIALLIYDRNYYYGNFDFSSAKHIIKQIILILGITISNFLYYLAIYIVIDCYSSQHVAICNLIENISIFILSLIYKKNEDCNGFKPIQYYPTVITSYLILLVGAFIHNELIILNFCGLQEKTQYFLYKEAEKEVNPHILSIGLDKDDDDDEENENFSDDEIDIDKT